MQLVGDGFKLAQLQQIHRALQPRIGQAVLLGDLAELRQGLGTVDQRALFETGQHALDLGAVALDVAARTVAVVGLAAERAQPLLSKLSVEARASGVCVDHTLQLGTRARQVRHALQAARPVVAAGHTERRVDDQRVGQREQAGVRGAACCYHQRVEAYVGGHLGGTPGEHFDQPVADLAQPRTGCCLQVGKKLKRPQLG